MLPISSRYGADQGGARVIVVGLLSLYLRILKSLSSLASNRPSLREHLADRIASSTMYSSTRYFVLALLCLLRRL